MTVHVGFNTWFQHKLHYNWHNTDLHQVWSRIFHTHLSHELDDYTWPLGNGFGCSLLLYRLWKTSSSSPPLPPHTCIPLLSALPRFRTGTGRQAADLLSHELLYACWVGVFRKAVNGRSVSLSYQDLWRTDNPWNTPTKTRSIISPSSLAFIIRT